MMNNFSYYRSILFRRFHYFLIVFLLVAAGSVAIARLLPPAYESRTTLILQSSQIPDELGAPKVQTGAVEELQIVEEGLMTRLNLLDIARSENVFENTPSMNPDDIVSQMNDATQIVYSAGRGEATLFHLSFSAAEGKIAANVVNRYVTIILQNDAEIRSDRATGTSEFFEEEVRRLGEALATQSAKLLKFNNSHSDALPDTLAYRLNQQTLLSERQRSTEAQVITLNEQRRRLIDVFNATGQIGAATGTQLSPAQQKLAALQDSLQQALAIYSQENPNVKVLKAQIAQQEAVVSGQSNIAGSPLSGPATVLDVNLANIDAQVDLLTKQLEQLQEQLLVLQDTIDRTPANAILLGELQRDHTNIQDQYNSAVGRLSQAAAGERIERLSKGQRIAVLDPATVPLNPTSPNRPLIAMAGTFVGAALGLGLIVLIELLNSSIRRPSDLTRGLGITPIVTIPYIRTPMELVMRRAAMVTALLAIVIGVPAALYAVHNFVMPLDLIYDKVAGKIGGLI